jgi:hypothetical protein
MCAHEPTKKGKIARKLFVNIGRKKENVVQGQSSYFIYVWWGSKGNKSRLFGNFHSTCRTGWSTEFKGNVWVIRWGEDVRACVCVCVCVFDFPSQIGVGNVIIIPFFPLLYITADVWKLIQNLALKIQIKENTNDLIRDDFIWVGMFAKPKRIKAKRVLGKMGHNLR